MHMPLTPEENLFMISRALLSCQVRVLNLLDKLLSLDVGHAVHTSDTITKHQSAYHQPVSNKFSLAMSGLLKGPSIRVGPLRTYPTERTRPVSARLASSWTPRMRCSRIEETSVGEALASAA